jgi:hypothetical protein
MPISAKRNGVVQFSRASGDHGAFRALRNGAALGGEVLSFERNHARGDRAECMDDDLQGRTGRIWRKLIELCVEGLSGIAN